MESSVLVNLLQHHQSSIRYIRKRMVNELVRRSGSCDGSFRQRHVPRSVRWTWRSPIVRTSDCFHYTSPWMSQSSQQNAQQPSGKHHAHADVLLRHYPARSYHESLLEGRGRSGQHASPIHPYVAHDVLQRYWRVHRHCRVHTNLLSRRPSIHAHLLRSSEVLHRYLASA
uniref:(northern house mosquito) hypothetical protein n=1 Tax=Culex pipiens TaxID=7175 RepID=A0A8D8E1U3_CULPI